MPPLKVKEKPSHTKLINILNDNFNIAIVFVVIIFLVVAYILVIKPKYDTTLNSIKDNISKQEQLYASQKQRLVDLKAAAELYASLDETGISKVNAILPAEYAKEQLFGQLEDIISQQGVLLTSINLTKESEKVDAAAGTNSTVSFSIPNSDKVGIIRAELVIGAIDYATLRNLLPLLESHVQLLDIESIDFDPGGESVSLSILTYYYK